MRRYIGILTLVVMLASLLGSSMTAFAEDYGYAIKFVVDTNVNIRNEKKEVIGGAKKGTTVDVVGENKYWYKVQLQNGKTGYIYKDYIHVGHAEELEAIEKAKRASYVKIDVNNSLARFVGIAHNDIKVYRDDLKTKMGVIPAGEKIFIRQTGKYWYKVVFENSKIGYIQAKSGFTMTGPNVPENITGTAMLLNVPSGEYAYLMTEKKGGKTIAKYSSGEPLTGFLVLEIEGGWAKVAYNDQGDVGYIGKKYLKSTKMFSNE